MLVEGGVDKCKGDYIDTPIRNLHLIVSPAFRILIPQ